MNNKNHFNLTHKANKNMLKSGATKKVQRLKWLLCMWKTLALLPHMIPLTPASLSMAQSQNTKDGKGIAIVIYSNVYHTINEVRCNGTFIQHGTLIMTRGFLYKMQ